MSLFSIEELHSERVSLHQWIVEAEQHWCLLGTTGAGKSHLARILQEPEEIPCTFQRFQRPASCLCVWGLRPSRPSWKRSCMTMIFVSHRQGEHLDVFKHHLDFEPGGDAALFTITSYSVPASRGLGH